MSYVEDYVKRLKQIQASSVAGSYVSAPASKSEIANLILQKARSDFSVHMPQGEPQKKENKHGIKSFALGLLDKLARPGYALAQAEQVGFNEGGDLGDVLHGAKEGFLGHKKTSFIDVLQNQHEAHVRESPEYQRILGQYGQVEADAFAKNSIKKDFSDTAGGLLVDLVQDPLNLIPISAVTKPIKAIKEISSTGKALEGIEAGARQIPTSDVSGAIQAAPKLPEEAPNAFQFTGTLKQGLSEAAKGNEAVTEIPRVTGKFASNRRPPTKLIEGEPVQALYGDQSKDFVNQLRANPRYANLADVFNKDLSEKSFEGLQKARTLNETAQVVDQAAKGGAAAVELITPAALRPLPPVARKLVDIAVSKSGEEIRKSIPDPARARAAGVQPRHPVFNAPSQSNLSQRLTNAARQAFTAETGQKITQAASPKFIPVVYERYINMLKHAEEGLIARGRGIDTLNPKGAGVSADAFYPRGGIKPNSPYLRLSDVLEALPKELAQTAILGAKGKGKVLPSILLKAVTGNNAALGKLAKDNRALFDAVKDTDWTPLMVKEHAIRTIDSANAAQETLNSAAGFVSKIHSQEASDTWKAAGFDAVVKAGKKEMAGEMPAAKASVGEVLDGLRKSVANPMPNVVDTIIERGKAKLEAAIFDSKAAAAAQAPRIEASAKGVEGIIQASAKAAGTDPALASAASDNIFSNVLSYIKPNAGYKDLRPVLLKNISVRKSSAATRAHEIIKVFGMIPEAQHMHFWNEVRGFIPPTADHAQPVALMQKMLGNMFGESGLESKLAGNTSLARSGLNIEHLNKHLSIVGIKDFKFERDIPDPLKPGKKVRLEGAQILSGWKNYVPKDSADLRVFTHNLTQAVENAMVEYSVWSNIGALWGKTIEAVDHVAVSGMHSAIDGMYFPTDLAPQMGKVARGIDEMFESVSNSKLMRAYDSALRTWKTGVTIYAPSHHIRNMVGDIFMAWLDGVENPLYYSRAATVLKANHHAYSDIKAGKSPLSDILGEGREAELIGNIIGQKANRLPKGTRVIATARVGNKKFPLTIDQVYQMGFRHGMFPHSAQIEDLPGTETLMEKAANKFHPGKIGPFAPAKGKVAHAVREVSETREHYVRIAHYLHALENTKANSLEELFQKSADRVRKYHPDGLDLTQTEKKVFRRVIPFYSWTRKAIPLVLEGLVMHPAKILAYPKATGAVQEYEGIDSSISDPWPDDQLFPDWLASNVIGPTIPWESSFAKAIARSDDEVGYGVVNPGNPATDILEQYFNNPVKGVGNSVSPFIKIPAELAFGTEFQSGAPIKDKTQYIDKNVPMLSTASRLTNGAVGTGLVEGGDLKGKETSAQNIPALINFLTGAGILDTGRYEKGGEFDLKKRLAEEKKNGAK